MDVISVANKLSKVASVKSVDQGVYEIVTGAKINSKTPIKIYLIEDADGVKLSDKKNTLKYMNSLYELKSPDVKNCIMSVLRIYGFSISSGELVALIKDGVNVLEVFYNYIICIGQLANMYAFFDQP